MTLLNYYRGLSSICSKKLKLMLFGRNGIALQDQVYSFMQQHPAFNQHPLDKEQSLSEMRLESFNRMKALFDSKLLTYDRIIADINNYVEFNTCVGMYDWSCLAKYVLSWQFMGLTLHLMGSERHKDLREKVQNMNILGSFALSELTHGSNMRGIQTTARFDKATGSFILNTPSLSATKCWVGNLGNTATHSVVFAQLYCGEGKCRGIHMFIVPVRDPRTLLPLPGILIGDMGLKLGLQGVDNGFMAFHNVAVPRENLLNRFSDVTKTGDFVTKIEDPDKRLSASLGALLMGRVAIIGISSANMRSALTIALRFSCQRRQFYAKSEDDTKNTNAKESAVIEYPMQLLRLVPNLAKFFVYDRFSRKLFDYFHLNLTANIKGQSLEGEAASLARHLHVISCGGKAVVTSCAQGVIQQCREACGGYGFLASAGFGKLRGDNDPQLTYEGDNHVLIQQLIAYILSHHSKDNGTLQFFDLKINLKDIPKADSLLSLETISGLVTALNGACACYMKRISDCGEYSTSLKLDLAKLVVNVIALSWFDQWLSLQPLDKEREFLAKAGRLFGITILLEHSSTLLLHKIIDGSTLNKLQAQQEQLSIQMKPELATAVDSIAPPDFVLNSCLGRSQGSLHHNLLHSINNNLGARPLWWKQAVYQTPSLCEKEN